jgi:hypothetical protein
MAKVLFLCKCGRLNIQPKIAYLRTCVKSSDENDWFKLKKIIGFLKQTPADVLTLQAGGEATITSHLDAAFGVHKNLKSHTGATMMLGNGSIQSMSGKQEVNARSSTEADLNPLMM